MTRVSEFFKIAEVEDGAPFVTSHPSWGFYSVVTVPFLFLQQVGIDKNDIPELTQVRPVLQNNAFN